MTPCNTFSKWKKQLKEMEGSNPFCPRHLCNRLFEPSVIGSAQGGNSSVFSSSFAFKNTVGSLSPVPWRCLK